MTAHTSEDTDIVHGRLARELSSALGEDAVTQRWVDRLKYAHDASHYLLVPQTVVTPRSAEQVATLLRACDRSVASCFSTTPRWLTSLRAVWHSIWAERKPSALSVANVSASSMNRMPAASSGSSPVSIPTRVSTSMSTSFSAICAG